MKRILIPIHSYRFYTSNSKGLAEIGPFSAYKRKIALEELKPNQDQMRSIVKLQKMCEKILDYAPAMVQITPSNMHSYASSSSMASSMKMNMEINSIEKSLQKVLNKNVEYGPKGLWLYGNVGTGKTLVMDLFFESVPVQRKKRLHFHVFMQTVYSKINHWNRLQSSSHAKQMHVLELVASDLINEAWLYCFDEFQVTDVATAAIMNQLFTYLFQKGAVVVATSNRLPDDLYSSGFQRSSYQPFIDLLKDRMEVVSMKSDQDYREMMLKENPTPLNSYFILDSPNIATFIKRVGLLFYGKQIKTESFEIYNRTVIIPKAADGIALYTFDELCGSDMNPMGAADYLKLCQLYHTIVIQSIPQMGLTEKNEARRFITFLDAAYENKVKLICSAETEPERLFVISSNSTNESSDEVMHKEMMGELLDSIKREPTPSEMMKLAIFTAEDERFAFKRAVSRLKEMQTQAYWDTKHLPVKSEYNGITTLDTQSNTVAPIKGPTYSSKKQDIKELKAVGDDFGDEASYAGYAKMYENLHSKDPNRKDPIMDTFKLKENNKPKFNLLHFWRLSEESWENKTVKMKENASRIFRRKK